MDPCEKKPLDTLIPMREQQREDITSSAQVHVCQGYKLSAGAHPELRLEVRG